MGFCIVRMCLHSSPSVTHSHMVDEVSEHGEREWPKVGEARAAFPKKHFAPRVEENVYMGVEALKKKKKGKK